MVIVGIGADIESIARFRNLPYKENKPFYRKIFTKKELEYCTAKADPYPHFAARFCAKEAGLKALGRATDLKNIEIIYKSGTPRLRINGCQDLKIFASLSHAKDWALAFVILTI
ncbi:hypothetical protein A2757_01365 [Candidatus Giovannonibacteria bacterium RIFCSPHIGHO2_01_FULL_48_47]|nr:MAG: hypothetical protein A2757_01365 [Candidatus Giovannonibacteria bacterium RIFCSPHIGHO2_01_FULL_48_47]OGF68378.1 MAG: hypothetical protein A3D61_00655 [Candidatus Giovannonibacteria bacterium RIFCSPHIGHO2_02_FULL_48_15]OGF89679.1 MAG: hypothetical protein A3B26_01490 [Candidatus Giovannonibacteria bacterium RIFCSPLOWO2_01_FULL_48_47]OGF95485.1 MAG: hypothetical protein A2433_00050 [Candidatus Giovannonibacteria bacterium RIFOXYC1_FULL_48_8]OGF96168.1 MAG: hypothetical protein A2613_01200